MWNNNFRLLLNIIFFLKNVIFRLAIRIVAPKKFDFKRRFRLSFHRKYRDFRPYIRQYFICIGQRFLRRMIRQILGAVISDF